MNMLQRSLPEMGIMYVYESGARVIYNVHISDKPTKLFLRNMFVAGKDI